MTTYRVRVVAFACFLAVIAAAAGAGLVFAMRAPAAVAHTADRSEFAGEWTPTAAGSSAKLRQIAAFVQARYRTPGAKRPLTDVTVRQPQVGGKSVRTFAIFHVATGQAEQFAASETAVFSECGSAPDCSIPGTKALLARLAERQALETALRSFRADDTLQLVLVELPVSVPQVGRVAVYFRRGDLARALERPLRATLPLNPPPSSDYANATERKAVATLVVDFAVNHQTPQTDRQRAFVLVPLGEPGQG